MKISVCYIVILFLMSPSVVSAAAGDEIANQKEKKVRIYRNPEERREAGIGTALTPWLTFSGLAEIEKNNIKAVRINGLQTSATQNASQTLQLGFDISAADNFEAEFVFEIEHDIMTSTRMEEGLIAIDLNDWGMKLGIQYLPFGEFNSYFVTGPMLEFGETRKPSLIIDYSFSDRVEVTSFIFSSDYNKQGGGNEMLDWGFSIEVQSADESVRVGASYLSDLTETEDPLLEDTNFSYQKRMPGWSAYTLLGMDQFELITELVYAIDTFEELDANVNKPSAYNIELAWFPANFFQFAARMESSKELSDLPSQQYGIAVSWRIAKRFSVSIDYLYGKFKKGFVVDDNGVELDHSEQFNAQLSVEF